MRHSSIRLLLLASTVVPAPLMAAELVVPTRVDAVTAFPDSAVVTRGGTGSLVSGEHVLVVSGLPAGLDRGSVRVEGAAPFALEIGSVEIRAVDPTPVEPARRSAAEKAITALRRERAALDDRIAAAEGRRRVVDRLAEAGTDGLVKAIAEGKAGAAVLGEVWTQHGDTLEKLLAAIRAAQERQTDIDEEIERIEKTLETDPSRVRPTLEARIAVTSRGEGSAALKLSYRVGAAGWRPAYDARLSTGSATEKPSLALATRAEVRQATGEDWTGIALTLSTARPSRGTAAARLDPLTVGLWLPVARPYAAPAPAAPATVQRKDALGGAADGRMRMESEAAAVAAPAPVEAVESQAEAESSGTTVLYRVPGRVDVASGAGERNLKVAEAALEPALSLRTVPKVVPAAYLTAAFKLPGEAPVLPGRVSIYRDGVFVGEGALPFTAGGDEVKLGFGEDERVRVERVALRQTEGETGTFSTSRVESRDFRIRVRNLRDRTLPVTVEDQIPVSESTEVTVERLSTTTPPTRVAPEDRRGVLAWTFDLKAGEEKEIRVGWRATWPADKRVRWSGSQR